jgi:beta-lactamase regulating signal transducer with metallopeptidase domain
MSMIEIQALGEPFAQALLGLLLRSSLLVIAGAFLLVFLRWQTAELRHWVCHCLLYGLLLLPLIECAAPPFRHQPAILRQAELAIFPEQSFAFADTRVTLAPTATITRIRDARGFPWVPLAAALYVCVTCALLLRLVLNLLRLSGLVNRSEPILDNDLRVLGLEIWLESLSHYRPRIRVSNDIPVPMAVGIEEATILLPASWMLWRREKLRAALIHEMAHVRRDDAQTAFLASFAVCLFWLNPLVYWLRRQLAALAEHACDETALRDLRPEEYARILVEFATEVGQRGGRLAAASTVAAERSLMGKRLQRIFLPRRYAQRTRPITRALLIAVFVPALYLAASARFEQQEFGSNAGRATDISVANQDQAEGIE